MAIRMSNTAKQDMLDSVDKLLGRSWQLSTCPFTPEQLIEAHNNMIPEKYLNAIQVLEEGSYSVGAMLTSSVSTKIQISDKTYVVNSTAPPNVVSSIYTRYVRTPIVSRTAVSNDASSTAVSNDASSYVADYRHDENRLENAWGDNYENFKAWVVSAGDCTTEMLGAWSTAEQILDMITTAGQLKRMVPIMVNFLPDAVAANIRAQKRSSSFPYKWAAYDRYKVERMLTCMAKCYLLPEIHGSLPSYPATYVTA